MRKKQLLLQSNALFAEIERKSGEIEGLNLRIDELKEKIEAHISEKEELESRLAEAEKINAELKETNEQLRASLLESVATKPEPSGEQIASAEPIDELTTEKTEVTAPIAPENPASYPQPENQAEIPATPCEEQNTISKEYGTYPPLSAQGFEKPKNFTPINDLLRDQGAQIIGKVTRITAQVMARVKQTGGDAAESLQTLALGKNESFKFQILSLLESGRDQDDIRAEMERLAGEAIDYLQSI